MRAAKRCRAERARTDGRGDRTHQRDTFLCASPSATNQQGGACVINDTSPSLPTDGSFEARAASELPAIQVAYKLSRSRVTSAPRS
jgi:hypothetical protein